MVAEKKDNRLKHALKTIGPGLLFASTAIGTSHLVLSTRAGAHHGMIFFWIILITLILKYPFYEFGPRYAAATGHSLLKGYKDQGNWAILLFLLVISFNMFAVTGAVGAVCAGLLSTMWGLDGIPMPVLLSIILSITAVLLLFGRYAALDIFIKVVSIVLLVTVFIAFIAVVIKGPVQHQEGFKSPSLYQGAGLALLISLIGFMPSGMEASTMHSIWSIEKMKSSGYRPTLKESLFDFHLGYIFTIVLALMFLTIGAFTVYGSGKLLEGNSTQFANKLLQVFTSNLGQWAFPIIAVAAFATIYGTLITAWDAFARSFVRGLRILKFKNIENSIEQERFLFKGYSIVLPLIGLGAFLLFYFSASSMIKILEGATILAFITAPIIAILNLRSIQSKFVPLEYHPKKWVIVLSIFSIVAMIAFSFYYLQDLMMG